MTGSRRVRIALAALAALVTAHLAVGCTALDGDGESSASCAFAVDHGDRVYIHVGDVEYELGALVGTARQWVCDDTGGSEEVRDDEIPVEELTAYQAYAIKGIDPDDAIAVRESPKDELSVMVHSPEDEPLTDATERLFGDG